MNQRVHTLKYPLMMDGLQKPVTIISYLPAQHFITTNHFQKGLSGIEFT